MKVYLVGGAVRDFLLGLDVNDRDYVVVGSSPEDMLSMGYQQVGKDFPVFLHPKTKEEYALARTERKSGNGHTGFSFNASSHITLKEDLMRRDITINAMAQDEANTLYDPFDGQSDLKKGIFRHVSPAFIEDPLRVFRVARFGARFCEVYVGKDFIPDPTLLDLMKEMTGSGELNHLPTERIWKEFQKSLSYKGPARFYEILKQCDAQHFIFSGNDQQLEQTIALLKGHTLSSPEAVYALACSTLSPAQLNELNTQIKPPNTFSKISSTVCAMMQDLPNAESAQDFLDLLNCAGVFSKKDHHEIFSVIAHHKIYDKKLAQLAQMIEPCQKVTAEPFIKQGAQGKAIADGMTEQRLKLINQLLKK